jgi:sugar phosphate isomerase/epimerase
MNRRIFLRTACAASAVVACGWDKDAAAAQTSLRAGIQLYAVREPLAADAPGTLKALHTIGFREVESAGTAGHSPAEFRKLVADAGLAMPSAHLEFRMENDIAPLLAEGNALGVEYAVSSFLRQLNDPGRMSLSNTKVQQPALPAFGVEGFKRMAARMNQIAHAANAAGLKYAYHNHNLEFEKLPDGSLGYDLLLRETDAELVKFEVDCGWMVAGGASPVEYFKKYPGRFRMIHVKDFQPMAHPTSDLVGPERPKGVELGRGFIDYKPIFAACKAAGIEHAFAEQEAPYTRPQLESAKVSYAYLQKVS